MILTSIVMIHRVKSQGRIVSGGSNDRIILMILLLMILLLLLLLFDESVGSTHLTITTVTISDALAS